MFPLTKQNEPLEDMGRRGQQWEKISNGQINGNNFLRESACLGNSNPSSKEGLLGSTTEAMTKGWQRGLQQSPNHSPFAFCLPFLTAKLKHGFKA